MSPVSANDTDLAEAHGTPLPETDLGLPFRLLFEITAKAFPDRIALVSLWEEDVEWRAFGANGYTTPSQDSVTAEDLGDSSSCASATASDTSSTPTIFRPIRWTYHELNRRSGVVASWLQDHGCISGDSLVAFLCNSADWAIFFWAAAKVDMTFVPLDPRTMTVVIDVKYLLETINPAVIVVENKQAAGIIDKTMARKSPLGDGHVVRPKIKMCCDETALPGWVTRATMVSRNPVLVSTDRPAILHEINATSEDDKIGNSFHATGRPGGRGEDKAGRQQQQRQHISSLGTGYSCTSSTSSSIVSTTTTTFLPPSLIVFTSGTTGRPKGCPHSGSNLWSQSFDHDPQPPRPQPMQGCSSSQPPSLVGGLDVDMDMDRWLVHTPVSHVFAVNNCLRAWRYGHTVVFASRLFDVTASLRALVKEKCTFMSAVPTLVRALLAHPEFPGKQALGLKYVTIGGTLIQPEDIQLCRDGLGAEHVVQGYGMSEGAPVISWCRNDPLLKSGYYAGAGKALPGAKIRVCHPSTRQVVVKGEVGELHIGGTSVIAGYLDGNSAGSFYSDHEGHWLVTGDQAVMDGNGVAHINGRYKDLIIRAGENINPVKIELALATIPGVVAQVVGVPNDISGEMPVAIIAPRGSVTVDKELVAKTALELGSVYALGDIISLNELSLDAFPTTASGKVKKQELKGLVVDYFRSRDSSNAANTRDNTMSVSLPSETTKLSLNPSLLRVLPIEPSLELTGLTTNSSLPLAVKLPKSVSNSTNETGVGSDTRDLLISIQEIFHQITHVRPGPDDDLGQLADSITTLRYCDRILNRFGVRIHIQDFVENKTLRQQASIISQRLHLSGEMSSTTMSGPLGIRKIGNIATSLDPAISEQAPSSLQFLQSYDSTAAKHLVSSSNILGQLGLDNHDIEDILPIKTILRRFAAGQRPQSYHNRLCFKLAGDTNTSIPVSTVHQAIRSAIAIRPMFRTVLVNLGNGVPFHIVLRPTKVVLDHIIKDVQLSTQQELDGFFQDDSESAFSPFLTTQAVVVLVEETGSLFLRMTLNHTIFDAVCLMPFYMDLDKLLGSPDWKPPTMTPFKLFSDLSNMYSTSPSAMESVAFHVERLRGISNHASSLFPRKRAPGWMIGSDSSSADFATREIVRNTIWPDWDSVKSKFRFPRFGRIINLPGLESLQSSHGIEAPILVKAAVALLNMAATGKEEAIFNVIEHGRSWPFLPAQVHKTLPSIMSVDGPTLEWVVNRIKIQTSGSRKRKDVTVINWLGQLTEDQREMERHVHAPWEAMLGGLGDEADVVRDASFRQTFVWDASLPLLSMAGGYRKLVPVGRYDWADSGLFWNACHLDKNNIFLVLSWDTAQMNDRQVEGLAEGVADLLRRLGDVKNLDALVTDILAQHLHLAEASQFYVDLE